MKSILHQNKSIFNTVLAARQQQATQIEQTTINLEQQRIADLQKIKLVEKESAQRIEREQQVARQLQLQLEQEKLLIQLQQDKMRDQFKVDQERIAKERKDIDIGKKDLAEVTHLLTTEHNKLKESTQLIQTTFEKDRETLQEMLAIVKVQKAKLDADIAMYSTELLNVSTEKNELTKFRDYLAAEQESIKRQEAIFQMRQSALDIEKEVLIKALQEFEAEKISMKNDRELLSNERMAIEQLKQQVYSDKEVLRLLELNIIHGKVILADNPHTRETEVTQIIEAARKGNSSLDTDVLDPEYVHIIGDM